MSRNAALAALVAILLLGAGLRLNALTSDQRFHADEALFATFARRAALGGAWMLPGSLDKPPLALYSMALAMLPFSTPRPDGLPELLPRDGEIAARLPGMLASLLLIPLTYALSQRLYQRGGTALLAALLVSLSPLAVAYGAAAFTDGLMLLFGTAALCCAVANRWGWAGTALALSFASKQQGLYLLPLIMGLGWSTGLLTWRGSLRFAAALAAGITALLGWDALRGGTSVFALALSNNDPARWIRSDEVLSRLQAWARLGSWFFMPVSALLIPAAFGSVLWRLRAGRSSAAATDIVLALYCIVYLLLHWWVAFNTYDRYLLLIMIPLALLSARGLITLYESLIGRLPLIEMRFIGLLFACAMAASALDASQGRLPIGVNSARSAGIDVVAAQLNALPLGTILYDHWLGWELDYYLGYWTDKRRVYYPTPRALVEDALRQPDPAPRYWVVPAWVVARPWLEALDAAGFAPQRAWQHRLFSAYRLAPPTPP